jgi:hypothetical protein
MSTWSKLPDNFYDDPRILAVGNEAAGAYFRARAYCNKHLTDGALPMAAARLIAGPDGRLWDVLTDARLMSADTSADGAVIGYRIAGFLDHATSAAEVTEKKAADAERKRKERERKKEARDRRLGVQPGVKRPKNVRSSDTDTDTDTENTPHTPHPGDRPDVRSDKHLDPKTGDLPMTQQVKAVFRLWTQVMGKTSAVLDENRRGQIEKGLKRHGLDVCLDAVRGCAASTWHMGGNPDGKRYDSLELIFRNAEQTEKFSGLVKPAQAPASTISDYHRALIEKGRQMDREDRERAAEAAAEAAKKVSNG